VGKLAGLDLTRATRSSAPPGGAAGGAAGRAAVPTTREAHFREHGLVPVGVLAREDLAEGAERPGPVIIESMDTTLLVPPGWSCRAGEQGCIVLERRVDPGGRARRPGDTRAGGPRHG